MAKVYGYYNDADGDPTQIGVTATPAESERLRDVTANRPPLTGAGDPNLAHHLFPANPRIMREIAKRVEVDCDDQRLIDWMAGKGR